MHPLAMVYALLALTNYMVIRNGIKKGQKRKILNLESRPDFLA